MSETPTPVERAKPYAGLKIDANGGAWTSVSAPWQAHSEELQSARKTQQELYNEAQGGYFDDKTGMVVVAGERDGAALAAIEADVAPRANRQYGVHTAPDATAGVTP